MKTAFRILAIILASIISAFARQVPEGKPPVTVVLDSIDLKDAGTDRVHFEVKTHVTASRNLKVKRLRFEHMHLGSMPIYFSPIDQHLNLVKGAAVPMPPIPLTIYFRDLDSLEPLEQAIRDGHATLSGQARVDLDLNLLERAASLQWTAYADTPIDMTVAINVPGGIAGRTAAIATLKAAQLALETAGSALHSLRTSQRSMEEQIRGTYLPALVVAESHYSILFDNDKRLDFVVRGLGFRISEDKFVLTGEMVQPWQYDVQVATALETGKATLVEDRRELLVWPTSESLDPNSARSLSRAQIQVERQPNETEITHVSVGHKSRKIQISERNTSDSYAILRFTRPEDRGSRIGLAPDSIRHSQNWDRLALFRVDDDGKMELVWTPARRQENRILLEDPIDDRAFGSVLIAPEGAVGMVQEEYSGMTLRADW